MSVPIINGTRFTVYEIVHYLESGWVPLEIAQVLRIPLEHVQAATHYIEEHREEVMAVHREIEERIARGNPPEIEAQLQESHARLMRRKKGLRRNGKQEVNGTGNACGR
jgi:uncharacterized protein (DUF433 family)